MQLKMITQNTDQHEAEHEEEGTDLAADRVALMCFTLGLLE